MLEGEKTPASRPPIRILRAIARLNIGGPALHATILMEGLDPVRYESLLIAGTEAAQEGDFLSLRGKSVKGLVRIPQLGREIRAGQDLRALFRLLRIIRTFRPHVVDTHTAKAGTLGRLAAVIAGVPVVLHTYHGHVLDGYFSASKTRLFLAIERWLAKRTTLLIAVSETVRRELLERGVGTPDRFVVIPLGLELDGLMTCEEKRGELRAELGLGRDMPLVGTVARLVPIKAVDVFLRAAALVAGQVPEARFLVVGGGEQRRQLETLARELGISDRTFFLGWRGDLERVYADLDLVVLTSRNEGSPMALIEAMAAGRAVVATRVGGVPDLVEDGVTGRLVAPDQPAALAERLAELLRKPELRAALGAAGRRRVYPAFTAKRLIADMDRLYGDLVRAAAPRG